MIKNNDKHGFYKIFLGCIFSLLAFLVMYRTIYPVNIPAMDEFNPVAQKKSEIIILENDKIAMNINLKGAIFEEFYFKEEKHYLFKKWEDNCFETLWISKNNQLSLPGRNTHWTLQSNDKKDNVVIIKLVTEIKGVKFCKTITMDEYKVTIEDKIINLPNYSSEVDEDLLSYGGFSCSQQEEKMEFISFLNNRKKVLRVMNKTIQKDSKQKISHHDGVLGIENNSFTALCEVNTNGGNIFLQKSTQNNSTNQMFFLSYGTTSKIYNLYLLPKKNKLLQKYNFNELMNYGTILYPLTYGFFLILNGLLEHFSAIVALLLIALFIILSNIYLIILLEREKYKLKLHSREKETIENNNKGRELEQQLAQFYNRHQIKRFRIIFLPVIMSLSWITLNFAVALSFDLRHQGFLWIRDLSLPDSYSIFNLYGILHFDPSFIPFYNYIASDVLSIYAATFVIVQAGQILDSNNNSSGPNNVAISNNLMMMIHCVTFLVMFKSVASGFTICFLTISLGNFIVSKIVRFFLFKKS